MKPFIQPGFQRTIFLSMIQLCSFMFFCGCIVKYDATGIEELADILVVEGIITDDETLITLSRSVNLSETDMGSVFVENARVYVDCDDGTKWLGEYSNYEHRYLIKTDKLNLEKKYRLRIEMEEPDHHSADCIEGKKESCPLKTYEYRSEYAYPVKTPEIDSIFWVKTARKQPVQIYVSTHSPESKILYYYWSYQEVWEIQADFWLQGYPVYCWGKSNSADLLIGSAEKTVFGQLTDKVVEIAPTNNKLSILYRIDIKQHAISKKTYNYFKNIKKNSLQTSGLFAPVPSELRGNIICTNDTERPVIGYVDISSSTHQQLYIPSMVWEPDNSNWDCDLVRKDSLLKWNNGIIPRDYVLAIANPQPPDYYVRIRCVDCTLKGGSTQEPDDWPER